MSSEGLKQSPVRRIPSMQLPSISNKAAIFKYANQVSRHIELDGVDPSKSLVLRTSMQRAASPQSRNVLWMGSSIIVVVIVIVVVSIKLLINFWCC